MPKFYRFPFASSGDRTLIVDTNPGDGEVNYETGWTNDYQKDFPTDPTARPIPRGQTNEFYYDVTDNIRQYQTHGVPEFVTSIDNGGVAFPYAKYARVRFDDGVNGFQLYESRIDNNTSLPSVATDWRLISGDAGGVPTGGVIDFAMATAPSGYLVCDGSDVSRTTYANLFAAIGVTWGVGDGSTTFTLPPARRIRISAGGSPTSVIGNTVGAIGGTETNTLTANQMAPHSHGINFPPGVVRLVYDIATGGRTLAGGEQGIVSGILPTIADNVTPNEPVNNMPPLMVMLTCIKF